MDQDEGSHGLRMRCSGGLCQHGVRCGYHAAEYAQKAMADRGWMSLDEIKKHSDAGREKMLKLAAAVGFECQRWIIRWVPMQGMPNNGKFEEGWYCPKHLAVPLALYVERLTPSAMESLLRHVKFNAEFAETLHAAYLTGGPDAVDCILDDQLPGLVVVNRAT